VDLSNIVVTFLASGTNPVAHVWAKIVQNVNPNVYISTPEITYTNVRPILTQFQASCFVVTVIGKQSLKFLLLFSASVKRPSI